MRYLRSLISFFLVSVIALGSGCGDKDKKIEADMTALSIVELREALNAGQITSEELVRQYLENIGVKSKYNTFITVDSEAALNTARLRDQQRAEGNLLGDLHGIPLSIKDNIHVAGMPNTAGTPSLKHFIPESDAEVVRRLRDAGAIILGKNNLHELAYGITSNNFSWGPVRNAHNPDYFAGGSSGGTAAAVALGLVAAGLGTDTGGSVRIPPALNGVVGFRPTLGRYPSRGLTSISSSRDTAGPIVKTVSDALIVDAVLADEGGGSESVSLKGLRLGVPKAYFYENLQVDVAETMAALLKKLSAAGVVLIEKNLDDLAVLNDRVGMPLVLYETAKLLPQYLAVNSPSVTVDQLLAGITSPDVKGVVSHALSGVVSDEQYQQVIEVHRPALQRAYRHYFDEHNVDAIIFPTTPLTARKIEGSMETVMLNGEKQPTFPAYIRNTDPASNAGIPGLSLPVGFSSKGLPIGVELDGPAGSDRRLLLIGAALETLILNSVD